MTLALRRKHQTTAWSTPAAKAHEAPFGRRWFARVTTRRALHLALLAMAVAMTAAMTGPAQADEVYSTSKNGQRLRWGPQRPVVQAAVAATPATTTAAVAIPVTRDEQPTVAVAHTEPTPARVPAAVPTPDPFDDPFGDQAKATAAQKQTRKAVVPATKSPAGMTASAPRRLRTVSQRDEAPDFPAAGRAVPRSSAVSLQPTPAKDPLPADLNDNLVGVDSSMSKSGGHCPDKLEFKPLKDIKTDLKPFKGMLPEECAMVGKPYEPRSWAETTFHWKASSLCHKPLYFEDVQLERYGHYWGPVLQPFLSAGHFFVSIPLLPYNMGLNPPNECIYSLGYYRPGSCSPYMLDPFPLSVRAGLMEAGAVTGLVFILP